MPSKRIMILTNRVPYPLNDGGNMAMHAIVNGYKHNGWDVFLLSMNTTRHKVDAHILSQIFQDVHFRTVDVDNRVKPFPTLMNYLFSKKANHVVRFQDKSFEEALKTALDEFKPDVVQIESIYLSTYLPVIKEQSDAKVVLRVHNIEHQIWNRLANSTEQFFKKKYLKSLAQRIEIFEQKAWQGYDMLLPITDVDAGVIKGSVDAAKVYTVPFGIDAAELSQTDKEKWVGYHIGAMDWLPNKEGIEWFLTEAMPEITQNIPEFKFYFAGRNMPESIEGDNYTGVYNEGEVPDAGAFIEDKKILIVPIHSGGGIRVKILEALAAGKLVISTDVGMQGIDAVPDEHYLKANTVSDFLLAISWSLNNKKQCEEITNAGRQLIWDKYNQTDIATRLSDMISKSLLHQQS